MNLHEIGLKIGTDKAARHQYLRMYERELATLGDDVALLELGIYYGASLMMWREFLPKARIVGVDISPTGRIEGTELILANAAKPFPGMEGPWDFIVDDGSHHHEDIIASFDMLFPFLNKGGKYIVEDVFQAPLDFGTRKEVPAYLNERFGKSEGKEYTLTYEADGGSALIIITKK